MPCENSETNYIRTGFETVVAHRSNETFACIASRDGVVEHVDNDLKLIRIRYDQPVFKNKARITTPLSKQVILDHVASGRSLFVTRPIKDSKMFSKGAVFLVNDVEQFIVVESISFSTVEHVPDADKIPKAEYDALLKAGAVVYIRLDPVKKASPEDIDIFQFGDKYTSVSGSFVRQVIVLNVAQGDRVKKGDIIAYNSGFFEPDPDSKQVTWKHGVMANVALMERSITLEDSCSISKELAAKLATSPAHIRTITIDNMTKLNSIVKIGEHVQTTDYLCTMEDGELDALFSDDDPDTLEFLAELNRKTPKAKYHGVIADIEIFHSCDFADLHPTIQGLARQLAMKKYRISKAAANTAKESVFLPPQKVPVGTKYRGVDFKDDTVVAIMFTITEEIGCIPGDKLVFMWANKTTIGEVTDMPQSTESGVPIDAVFAGASLQNRIVISPLVNGIGNRVMEKAQEDVVAMYFNED